MRILCFILILLTCTSCDPEKPDSSVVLPTSLNTSFNIDEGFVEAQATAQGANFYSFMFYDNGDSTYVESTDGSASYNFATTGVYTIKSRAHVTPYDFIEKTPLMPTIDIDSSFNPFKDKSSNYSKKNNQKTLNKTRSAPIEYHLKVLLL